MASEYTPNFNLDKYVGTDKPNLRDQYNSAMNKIDTALSGVSSSASGAVTTANAVSTALGSGFDATNNVSAIIGSKFDAANSISSNIDRIDSDISAIQSVVGHLGNALYIGNSFTTGVGSTGGSTGLYALTKDLFAHSWMRGTTGGGFGTYQGHNETYYNVLVNLTNSLTAEQKQSITHVIFISAVGDTHALVANSYDSSWLTGTFSLIKQFVSQYLPNAHVYIFNADQQSSPNVGTPADLSFKNSYKMHTLFLRACDIYGFTYSGWAGFNTTYDSTLITDNVHPNDSGYAKLASMLSDFLHGYNVKYNTFSKSGSLTIKDSNNNDILIPIYANATIDGLSLQVCAPLESAMNGATIPAQQSSDFVDTIIGRTTGVLKGANATTLNELRGVWYPALGFQTTPTNVIGTSYRLAIASNNPFLISFFVQQEMASRFQGTSLLVPNNFFIPNTDYTIH